MGFADLVAAGLGRHTRPADPPKPLRARSRSRSCTRSSTYTRHNPHPPPYPPPCLPKAATPKAPVQICAKAPVQARPIVIGARAEKPPLQKVVEELDAIYLLYDRIITLLEQIIDKTPIQSAWSESHNYIHLHVTSLASHAQSICYSVCCSMSLVLVLLR